MDDLARYRYRYMHVIATLVNWSHVLCLMIALQQVSPTCHYRARRA